MSPLRKAGLTVTLIKFTVILEAGSNTASAVPFRHCAPRQASEDCADHAAGLLAAVKGAA